ncbi:organic solvent tolerance protein OstA [Bradyrhizobium sacchari]|uniref:Lipopolysaccharide export system protein LptA n=1 Tax=Bradyrhizobium sacchari TaxID=1399419 RepID=A0A560KLK5_9BRAD|nr:LptA/OstA family protein [Bradyrhizobium sacchari]OPZ01028.1 organic solvent tolerance protein OstA [Bradyrhizobium sacchari]TWB65277.1 lipopolysaccharide export system protein LptA [Bradyrhizobium sacchari]TWB81600.1 lipopolysaccharide export system protein LptA [Bradyrhizobium sacchari]
MIRFFPRNEDKRCAIIGTALVFGVALVAGGAAIAQSTMQGVPNAMQGFSQNRDQPIQIEAASLEMRDKKKEATFAGNVKVVQGDTTMTSKTLVVFYEAGGDKPAPAQPAAKGAKEGGKEATKGAPMQSATPGPGGSSAIKRLEARGNVVVTQKDQVVTGETAVFDTKTNLITMFGGGSGPVVMTQCKNVMRGDRLTVDMTTGVSRVESDSGRGVQVLLPQGAGSDCGQGGKPGAAPPLALPGASKPK